MRQGEHPNISCIVLIGGKSVRFGHDKAFEPFGLSNLTERVLSQLIIFKSDVIIVVNAGQSYNNSSQYPGLRVIDDVFPGRGPLGGIYTGLAASNTFYNLVVACDMPFINMDLLNYMIRNADGFDIVVPRFRNFTEPLHAIYSKRCLESIRDLIMKNDLRVSQLFPLVKVRYIEPVEIRRFDPKYLSFFNVNTEVDLKNARELLKNEQNTVPPNLLDHP